MATTAAPTQQTSSASFPKRLWRVLRQLILLGVSAAAYYVLMTWLLERFGGQGFLYALLVLAAAMALFKEFGSDVAGIPGRIRKAGQRRKARKQQQKPATEEAPDSAAPVSAPEPTSRSEAESLFQHEQQRLRDGAITQEEFDGFAKGLFFVDGQGKFWTIQPDTGKWAYFGGGQWHPGLPLGTITRAQLAQAGQ